MFLQSQYQYTNLHQDGVHMQVEFKQYQRNKDNHLRIYQLSESLGYTLTSISASSYMTVKESYLFFVYFFHN